MKATSQILHISVAECFEGRMPLTQSVIWASVLHHGVHMIRHLIMLNMDTYHYLHTSSHRRLLEAMLSVLKIGMRYNNAHGTNMWDIGASKLLFMASWSVFWIWNGIRWVLILQTWGLLPHVYPECNEPIEILFWILSQLSRILRILKPILFCIYYFFLQ